MMNLTKMMEANMAAGFEQSFEQQSGGIFTNAGYDPIALLPPRAAELLRQLRQKARDAHSLIPEFADRHEANTARGDAERRLQRLLAPRSENKFNLSETDPQVIEARRQVEKLADEARRLAELDQVRSEAWRSASRVVQTVEDWVKNGRPPGTVLQDHEVEVPKLLKGESILDAIERLRRRGRELRADQRRIQSAPYPSSHAKQQMRAQIEALAMQGAPSVSDLIEHDRKIVWPTQRVTSSVYNTATPAIAFAELDAAIPLLIWLHKDAMIAALDREIATEADDGAALSPEAREEQEAELMGDLLAVERDEAALVWSAMAQGLPAEHRNDCAPAAILQVRLLTAPHTNGSRGSSWMHAWDVGGR
jgi:hypothetical protein